VLQPVPELPDFPAFDATDAPPEPLESRPPRVQHTPVLPSKIVKRHHPQADGDLPPGGYVRGEYTPSPVPSLRASGDPVALRRRDPDARPPTA
jgi:hypothetical protein